MTSWKFVIYCVTYNVLRERTRNWNDFKPCIPWLLELKQFVMLSYGAFWERTGSNNQLPLDGRAFLHLLKYVHRYIISSRLHYQTKTWRNAAGQEIIQNTIEINSNEIVSNQLRNSHQMCLMKCSCLHGISNLDLVTVTMWIIFSYFYHKHWYSIRYLSICFIGIPRFWGCYIREIWTWTSGNTSHVREQKQSLQSSVCRCEKYHFDCANCWVYPDFLVVLPIESCSKF